MAGVKSTGNLEELDTGECSEIGGIIPIPSPPSAFQPTGFYSNKNYQHLVSSLMREKTEGRIPGIIGRVGDFGEIDAKYDIAVSEALPHLDDIAVDTYDTAVECANFVEKNGLGPAMFMVEQALVWAKHNPRRKKTTPENVLRLIDLIKVKDKRLLPTFRSIAGDTMVADTCEVANSLRWKYRVVTLEGVIVEGAHCQLMPMTPMKGRMGITSAVEKGCSDLNVEPTVREENIQGDI